MNREQQILVDEIIKRESMQNKVDQIVRKVKEALAIMQSEGPQARVDRKFESQKLI